MTTTMFSTLARQAGRLWALGLAAGLALTMAAIGPADAHGEKSQAAFLRMRTLNWDDVKWSKTNVTVNEEYEITGKLHIMNSWPAAIEVPAQCFLNTGQPGAMAARLGVWVGGTFTPRSMKLELGKTYAFRVLLKARRPGHWHTHVQLSVKTGGPIPGPGAYIDIKGNFSDYRDDVKLLDGTAVDIETYGEGKILTDIHRMIALLTQVCRRTMVFARASLAWSAGMLRRPVTSARRGREAPKFPSSRGTSPMVLAGTDGDRTRVTLVRDQAAAAVPRSGAGCQRINAVRWRPRPSGRQCSGRGARPSRRS